LHCPPEEKSGLLRVRPQLLFEPLATPMQPGQDRPQGHMEQASLIYLATVIFMVGALLALRGIITPHRR